MNRLNSSDSLGALISICASTEKYTDDGDKKRNQVYGRDYATMFDEQGEIGQVSKDKKRRLSVVQVKALESDFEEENKLEPDRKAKLAHDLGLQPRQVAVWFQNRRARWKTKQLERDYGILKANFDALKCDYDSVQRENKGLVKEIGELKSKLQEDNSESTTSMKKEPIISETEDQLIEHASIKLHSISSPSKSYQPNTDPKFDTYYNRVSIFKDGGVSDCSECSEATMSSSSLLHFTDTNFFQPQFVKNEEHYFFSGDEACNFFFDDQAPTLQWFCSEQWS